MPPLNWFIAMVMSGERKRARKGFGKRGFHRWASKVKWLLRHILAPKNGAAVFHSPLDLLGLPPKRSVPTGKQFYPNDFPVAPSV